MKISNPSKGSNPDLGGGALGARAGGTPPGLYIYAQRRNTKQKLTTNRPQNQKAKARTGWHCFWSKTAGQIRRRSKQKLTEDCFWSKTARRIFRWPKTKIEHKLLWSKTARHFSADQKQKLTKAAFGRKLLGSFFADRKQNLAKNRIAAKLVGKDTTAMQNSKLLKMELNKNC